jgi:hypothetical protein
MQRINHAFRDKAAEAGFVRGAAAGTSKAFGVDCLHNRAIATSLPPEKNPTPELVYLSGCIEMQVELGNCPQEDS